MQDLTLKLARAGLVQFGRFERPNGEAWPVMVNLLWLPSYPALLRDVAAALVPTLDGIAADRVLTTVEALPIGVALSLRADMPLVYPYGEVRDYTTAYAIEGAYDVGHPTLLLSDVLIDARQANQIAAMARKVGLEVNGVLAVVDLGLGAREELESIGHVVRSALRLSDMLPVLAEAGLLPLTMRETVEAWIAREG
jgi:uridine monophosphate synthetase